MVIHPGYSGMAKRPPNLENGRWAWRPNQANASMVCGPPVLVSLSTAWRTYVPASLAWPLGLPVLVILTSGGAWKPHGVKDSAVAQTLPSMKYAGMALSRCQVGLEGLSDLWPAALGVAATKTRRLLATSLKEEGTGSTLHLIWGLSIVHS